MKKPLWFILTIVLSSPCLNAQVTPPFASSPTVIEAGPDHRVWQRVVSDGLGQFVTNSFTELAT
jgi:hypothetical protein